MLDPTLAPAQFWQWDTHIPKSAPFSLSCVMIRQNMRSSRLGCPVQELGAPNYHGADLGTDCPSADTGIKIGPSAETVPVPKWDPTYIYILSQCQLGVRQIHLL